jgi:hypothetical protein
LQCNPRAVDRERAIRLQREKYFVRNGIGAVSLEAPAKNRSQNGADGGGGAGAASGSGTGTGTGSGRKRKERRISISNANGPPPNVATPGPKTPGATAATGAEDEPIDIESEIRRSYVQIADDSVPLKSTRESMRQYAQTWRGVTALGTDDALATKVVHIPGDPADVSAQVRPPMFGLQTTKPIRGAACILPYKSVIVPSGLYLADPLNEYAHMGEWSDRALSVG